MRACNAPFFRVVKVFNKKAVRRTNPWEFGQGVGGRNGTKKIFLWKYSITFGKMIIGIYRNN